MFRGRYYRLVVAVVISSMSISLAYGYSGGNGEPNNPYQIANKADLLQLAATTADYGRSFILTADINLSGTTYATAIIAPDTDAATTGYQGTTFSGTFDGNGHTIFSLTINAGTSGNDYLGLFGCISQTGMIKNLPVESVYISGSDGSGNCAGIVAWNLGTVLDSHSSGSVSGEESIGGMVGSNYHGTITRCYANANVAGSSSNIGGLVGLNNSTIIESYADGLVSGGINVGGLVGQTYGSSTIVRCYATGNVSGRFAGGLVGMCGGSVEDSYATGDATLTTAYCVGGLVGDQVGGSISRCYSTGHISGTGDAGGLIGYHGGGTTVASFWDTQTSGRTTSAGGMGRMTAQMQMPSTFAAAGWDFVGETANGTNDYWQMLGGTYPLLSFQPVGSGMVAMPAFSVADGTYYDEKNVVITCATAGAVIHYTTNGIDPAESDAVLTSGSSVYVDRSLTLKAKAWKTDMTASAVASTTYTIQVSTPAFGPAAGAYDSSPNVIITCATAGATIHYTTNGFDPTESDPVIASGTSVLVDHSLTLKAKAWKAAMMPSAVMSGTYNIVVMMPVFSPLGGTYNTEQNVVITCATAGATIHYTTNGLDPNESGPVVVTGSSVLVDHELTLKARAWKAGCEPSDVMTSSYYVSFTPHPYSGGSGTATDPYQIATKEDLLALSQRPHDYSSCFVLTADIDLTGETFTTALIAPDTGMPDADFDGTMFSGTFDGDGHAISNLTVDTGAIGNDFLGLFGCTSETSVIKYVGVESVSITGIGGSDVCGGLVGWNKGTVVGSHSKGAIFGQSTIGGLVGRSSPGSVTSCYSTVNVTGSGNIGGLVGANTGAITESYAAGVVTGVINVGGLAGAGDGIISRCYATGRVSGCYVGGLIGSTSAMITDCYARGTVILTTADCAGGLTGYQSGGTISRCYSTGYISGTSNAGGLIGYRMAGITTASFWDTETSGKNSSAGGMGMFTAWMQMLTTYTRMKWDFVGETANGINDYWQMPAGSYPLLAFQPVVTDFVPVAKRRVGRTIFDYDCKVVLTNNSTQSVRVTQFQLQTVPASMSIVDASASGFGDIGSGESAMSGNTCTFRVDRSQPINAAQVQWQVTYEVLGTSQTMQLSSMSELKMEPKAAGDMTGDDAVDSTDLMVLSEQWLVSPGDPSADINGDGVVNFADFAVLAGRWMQ